jgi:hypothetical protein
VRLQLQQLDLQLRMLPRQPGHGGHGQGVDRALERSQPHQPGRLLAESAQLRLDALHVVEDRPCASREYQAGRRQPHATTGAFEEPRVRLGLQHGELLGHARRAQVGGPGDRAHGAQRFQPAQQLEPPRVQHAAIVVRPGRTAQPQS